METGNLFKSGRARRVRWDILWRWSFLLCCCRDVSNLFAEGAGGGSNFWADVAKQKICCSTATTRGILFTFDFLDGLKQMLRLVVSISFSIRKQLQTDVQGLPSRWSVKGYQNSSCLSRNCQFRSNHRQTPAMKNVLQINWPANFIRSFHVKFR